MTPRAHGSYNSRIQPAFRNNVLSPIPAAAASMHKPTISRRTSGQLQLGSKSMESERQLKMVPQIPAPAYDDIVSVSVSLRQ